MSTSYYKDIYSYLTRKYPNRKVYIISDHHFFHNNIIQYERTLFDSVEEMNNYMISVHNETVKKDDIVIFLGDFSFRKNEIKEILSKMNGHKFLIMGNHDSADLLKYYQDFGFEMIFSNPVKFNDDYLSHYPLDDKEHIDIGSRLLFKEFNKNENGINYHGHIHIADNNRDGYFNVSCEALNYKPICIGYTGDSGTINEKKLLIEDDRFIDFIKFLVREKNFTPTLLITDYIYSMMLETISNGDIECCMYGSYPQYKKYSYISNFGDLDVSLIYDSQASKSKNEQKIKIFTDRIYSELIGIEGIDLNFIKRYINMCAFGYLFSNGHGYVAKGALDVNMVPFNFYKDSDFVLCRDISIIERFISIHHDNLLDEFRLPRFRVNFLTSDGDVANLVLQILYQNGNEQKKGTSLKKLRYITKFFGSSISMNDKILEDTITRFFLRNVMFFLTLNRMDDIDYIKICGSEFSQLIKLFPNLLQDILEDIIVNPNSDFNHIVSEINNTPKEEMGDNIKRLVRKLK